MATPAPSVAPAEPDQGVTGTAGLDLDNGRRFNGDDGQLDNQEQQPEAASAAYWVQPDGAAQLVSNLTARAWFQ